jgi:two-component system, NarL family, sensor kinase
MPSLVHAAQPGRRRRRHVGVVAVGVLLPAVWTWWARLRRVSDGTVVLPVPGHNTLRIAAVYASGSRLRAGDVVQAVDGIGINTWVSGHVGPVHRSPGMTVHYRIARAGIVQVVPVQLKSYPFLAAWHSAGVLLALVVVLLLVGSTVYLLRPDDPAARTMLVAGVALPCVIPEYPLGMQVIDLAGGDGVTGYVGADLAAAVLWGAVLCFSLVFPEPRPWLRRRPYLAVACFVAPLVLWIISWAWTLPQARTPLARLFVFITVSVTASRVLPALAGIRLFLTYRTTTDVDVRRWLRWIMGSIVFGFAGYLLFGQLPAAIGSGPLIGYQWLVLPLVFVPLSIGGAILRYRLFDIEVILSRSLLVGALIGCVVFAYGTVVVTLPSIAKGSSTLVALLLGSVVALGAFGLSRILTRRITRLVYGARSDPHAVLSQLSSVQADPNTVLPDVVKTLATTLRLPYVRLQLLGPDGGEVAAAAFGHTERPPTILPIGDQSEPLGRLELGTGMGREPFGPADRRLLDDLSHQLTGAARVVLLAQALQRSREQLVVAREEERRRLRRDLHDGVGPTLAAMAMQLEVAGPLITREPKSAAELTDTLAAAAHGLIGEVRRIVEDLRPPALDELGLVSAIRESVRQFDGMHGSDHPEGFWIEVTAANDLGELPAAAEVAAFRIALEAVANAARYSRARYCTVSLIRSQCLTLTITDDGRGLQSAVYGTGVGLASMRERAAELGGRCTVTSRTDGPGTVVGVELPLRRLEADHA